MPQDFGASRAPIEAVRGGTPLENAATMREIFSGKSGPQRDIVVANAAAALVASEIAPSFLEGARVAGAALSSGAAGEKLEALVEFTQKGGVGVLEGKFFASG